MGRPKRSEAEQAGQSAKRTAILWAAGLVFGEVGYTATSMDTVAARAGVSKATIYAHFTSKAELFGAVIRARCEAQIGEYAASGSCLFNALPAENARAGLTEVGRQFLGLMIAPETLAMYRMIVAEGTRQPEMVEIFHQAGPVAAKTALSGYLERLTASGQLNVSDDDTWNAADAFFALLRGEFYMRRLMGLPDAPGTSPEGVVERAVTMMLARYGVK